MTYHIQIAVDKSQAPSAAKMRLWARQALTHRNKPCDVTIRIVGVEEMTALNSTYRRKNGPTNVLSFPFEMPDEIDLDVPILGDIAICADVVNREANEQGKPHEAHWAHMVVHGLLHLQGYDHEIDHDATIMETLEIDIMKTLGFRNPYEIQKV